MGLLKELAKLNVDELKEGLYKFVDDITMQLLVINAKLDEITNKLNEIEQKLLK